MQEPGKALANSFSSLCGIQINKYFSRVNLNTSYFCHSVACLWQRWARQPLTPHGLQTGVRQPLRPNTDHSDLLSPWSWPCFEWGTGREGPSQPKFSSVKFKTWFKWIFGCPLSVPAWSLPCSFWIAVGYLRLQQQRNNIYFARKEHSWCKKGPE